MPAPPNDDPQGLSRRRWLQLMGASLALAGAGGCRWEKTELLAFAKRPPGRIPGKVEKFATAMELGGSALGLMVTCVDGRPIKIEGNPKASLQPRRNQRLRPGGHSWSSTIPTAARTSSSERPRATRSALGTSSPRSPSSISASFARPAAKGSRCWPSLAVRQRFGRCGRSCSRPFQRPNGTSMTPIEGDSHAVASSRALSHRSLCD